MFTQRLQALEGQITDLVIARGIIDFRLGTRLVTLAQSRAGPEPIRNGDALSVVARSTPFEGTFEVLAMRRAGEASARYTGPRVRTSAVLMTAAFCAWGLSLSGLTAFFALLVGLPMIAIQLLFVMQMRCVMRFAAETSESDTRGKVHYAHARAAPPLGDVPIPLTLPFGSHQNAHGANLDASGFEDGGLLEFTHDAIIIWEMDGEGILYWNRAAEQLYGYSRAEVRGKVTHTLLGTRLAGTVSELETKIARHGVWIGELRHTARDGRHVVVDARLALMSQRNGRWLVLEVNRDVTDRKRAEAERLAMEKHLEAIRCHANPV